MTDKKSIDSFPDDSFEKRARVALAKAKEMDDVSKHLDAKPEYFAAISKSASKNITRLVKAAERIEAREREKKRG